MIDSPVRSLFRFHPSSQIDTISFDDEAFSSSNSFKEHKRKPNTDEDKNVRR